MSAAVETSRREWEESAARLEAVADDRAEYLRLLDQVELIVAELRRRVGQTFTLDELADAYGDADRWAYATMAEAGPRGWPRTLSLVTGAAFHRYARGASDWRP
ncbi:MAG: hypothetical protein ACM33B_03050 [Pseudomonadota bacterium]